MRTPAQALVWEAWRQTRARFAFAAGIATIGCAAILVAAGDRAAFILPFLVTTIAVVTVIDLPIAGSRSGFPFRASFTRPVSTAMLVLAPMVYLAVLGAALYLVPIVVTGVLFDVSFPLIAVPAWIGAVVLALTAVSWWSNGAAMRFVGKVVVLLGTVELVRRFNSSSPFRPDPSPGNWPEVLYLSFAELVALCLLGAAAIVWAARGVKRQRHMADRRSARGFVAGWRDWTKVSIAERLRDGPAGLDRLPCPTASRSRAELWLETRRRGLPVLGTSVGIAAVIPVVLAVGRAQGWDLSVLLAFASFASPVFVALGVPGERRSVRPGALSPFEASRPIPTARLAAVRIAVPAVAILAGWLAIGLSLWVSLPLLGDVWNASSFRGGLAARLSAMPTLRLAAWSLVALVLFAAAVAALSAINAYFVLYRRRLAGAFLFSAVYAIAVLVAAAVDLIGFDVVVWHLWAIAAAIGAGTAFVFARMVAAQIIRPAHAGVAMLAWLVFVALWAALLADALAPAGPFSVGAALAAICALTPLLSFALGPWSLHRLRHT